MGDRPLTQPVGTDQTGETVYECECGARMAGRDARIEHLIWERDTATAELERLLADG